jgi:hypothetical protein
MNFFKLRTTWANSELILLKLCIASSYILVGAYFRSFVSQYRWPFVTLSVITVIWSVYLWITKMKKENK